MLKHKIVTKSHKIVLDHQEIQNHAGLCAQVCAVAVFQNRWSLGRLTDVQSTVEGSNSGFHRIHTSSAAISDDCMVLIKERKSITV